METLRNTVIGLAVDSVRVFVLGKYWVWFAVPLFSAPALSFLQMWAVYLSWSLFNTSSSLPEERDIKELFYCSLAKSLLYLALGFGLSLTF